MPKIYLKKATIKDIPTLIALEKKVVGLKNLFGNDYRK